jgi:hypothetical protein
MAEVVLSVHRVVAVPAVVTSATTSSRMAPRFHRLLETVPEAITA